MKGETAKAARRNERDNKGRLEKVLLKWKNIKKHIFKKELVFGKNHICQTLSSIIYSYMYQQKQN